MLDRHGNPGFSLFCTLMFLLLISRSAIAQRPQVTNLASGETFRYPVVILKGTVALPDDQSVQVLNETTGRPEYVCRVIDGKFKGLTELIPGQNRIRVKTDRQYVSLNLKYVPQTNPNKVRIVYFTDSSGDTKYQTQKANDRQNFAEKLDVSMKLLQTFSAEELKDRGYGRKTFNLEMDDNGKVNVFVFKGKKTHKEYDKLPLELLYSEIYQELDAAYPDQNLKFIAIIAFSRFDAETKKIVSHTALGGGRLGLFGSVGMFVWPDSVQSVPAAFSDSTPIDTLKIADDSAGRGVFWGQASTNLGAVLHEISHAFDLPHSGNYQDIMWRGFDGFNRWFLTIEAPSVQRRNEFSYRPELEAHFDHISAPRLAYNAFFRLDELTSKDPGLPNITIDIVADNVVFEAPAGISLIAYDGDGNEKDSVIYPNKPKIVTLKYSELFMRTGPKSPGIRLYDTRGRQIFRALMTN